MGNYVGPRKRVVTVRIDRAKYQYLAQFADLLEQTVDEFVSDCVSNLSFNLMVRDKSIPHFTDLAALEDPE